MVIGWAVDCDFDDVHRGNVDDDPTVSTDIGRPLLPPPTHSPLGSHHLLPSYITSYESTMSKRRSVSLSRCVCAC